MGGECALNWPHLCGCKVLIWSAPFNLSALGRAAKSEEAFVSPCRRRRRHSGCFFFKTISQRNSHVNWAWQSGPNADKLPCLWSDETCDTQKTKATPDQCTSTMLFLLSCAGCWSAPLHSNVFFISIPTQFEVPYKLMLICLTNSKFDLKEFYLVFLFGLSRTHLYAEGDLKIVHSCFFSHRNIWFAHLWFRDALISSKCNATSMFNFSFVCFVTWTKIWQIFVVFTASPQDKMTYSSSSLESEIRNRWCCP